MGNSKVIIGFSNSRYSDLEIIAKGDLIQQQMTDNEHFLDPQPPLILLTMVRANFLAAFSKSADGSKEDTLLKNRTRLELENVLRQLGQYVQSASFGYENRILSSGFDMAKKPEPIRPLVNPTGLVVSYGQNSGEVIMECDPVKNALMYDFQYTQSPVTPSSSWTSVQGTKRKAKAHGLTRAVEYVFRVAGMNSDPVRNWSEPVSKLVV